MWFCLFFFFFFSSRRRHTRLQGDWSSDVCSSDLCRAVIGRNFNLSQCATIGTGGSGEKMGAPAIGDGVYVAPGARVFGRITIGSNVKIGANAVVYKDIPDNAVVALDPGFRLISF